MKLQHNYDKLTKYQENLLQRIENSLNEENLFYLIVNEDKAWEQWCESHEDYFSTVEYSGGWNTPPGTIFRETEGPDGFEDVGEEEIYETSEGEDRLFEVQCVIDFVKKYINDILAVPEEEYATWYETTLADLSYDDETVRDCDDGDNVWTLIEYILAD